MREKFAQKNTLIMDKKSLELKSNLVDIMKRRDTATAEGIIKDSHQQIKGRHVGGTGLKKRESKLEAPLKGLSNRNSANAS